MKEKVLNNKKHGMLVLVVCILLLVASFASIVITGISLETSLTYLPVFIASVVVLCVAWIPLLGLRILKPSEALVLTLFGKYVGTIKGDGFYAVNPFCSSVNPAADTKLSQSGDVKKDESPLASLTSGTSFGFVNKKRLIFLYFSWFLCNLSSFLFVVSGITKSTFVFIQKFFLYYILCIQIKKRTV